MAFLLKTIVLPIESSFALAGVVRNLGFEYTNNLRTTLPIESGIGLNIKVPNVNTSLLADILYNIDHGKEMRFALATDWKHFNMISGCSISENRNAFSLGFSFNYRSWKVNYGMYFHENSAVLGTPRFLDVRLYL